MLNRHYKPCIFCIEISRVSGTELEYRMLLFKTSFYKVDKRISNPGNWVFIFVDRRFTVVGVEPADLVKVAFIIESSLILLIVWLTFEPAKLEIMI
jgi:hypothetical protein